MWSANPSTRILEPVFMREASSHGVLSPWAFCPSVSYLSSGSSLDRPWLDYGPTIQDFRRLEIYRFLVDLSEKLMWDKPLCYWGCRPEGAGPTRSRSENERHRGNVPPLSVARKLNRAPFPALVWSSATRSRESWQPQLEI